MTDQQTRVRDALREYADAVPVPAGDVEAVLTRTGRRSATAPRHRRLRWLVPAGAAIAVMVAIGVAILVPRQEEGPAPIGVSWLPSRIEHPNQPPPTLPTDKGVGLGSVIYSPCEEPQKPATCKEYLITEDDTHFLIPGSSDKYGNEDNHATLSPDGRWLGVTRPGEFQLRDLTGTQVHTVDGDQLVPMAWSSNGRWLVVGPSGIGPEPEPVWRLNTRTGETKEVKAPFRIVNGLVIDVTNDGEVLLAAPDPRCREGGIGCIPHSRGLDDIALVDPDRGEQPLWIRTLDDDQLHPDEPAKYDHPIGFRLTPDGTSLLVALSKRVEFPGGGANVFTSGDLLLFDLAAGKQTGRYDVADGRVRFEMPNSPDPKPIAAIHDEEWRLLAHEGDGILLHGTKAHDDSEETGRSDARIAVVDPDSGDERVDTRAPRIQLIAVRGSINLAG